MRILILTLVMSFLSHSAFGSEEGGVVAAKGGGAEAEVRAKKVRTANDTDKIFFHRQNH